ncbi:MAG: nicotinate-nucleotide adenylyltransferase [Planctomycetota bacterium]|nr:MAG: nicotinate-nucleotide adenylyltransferase [Planctomycetota bacterium]
MRLGIFGGTFDPVHLGHLIVAEQCREQCALDEVRFIPAGEPPHKRGRPLTAAAHRLAMLRFAVAGHSAFRVDDRETKRPGPSYTATTLEEFRDELPQAELFLILGRDSLLDLPNWHRPERICALATLVVADRPLSRPNGSGSGCAKTQRDSREPAEQGSRLPPAARIVEIDMPAIGISATDLRRRVAEGRSIRYFVPRAVEVYIAQQGLYRGAGTPSTD